MSKASRNMDRLAKQIGESAASGADGPVEPGEEVCGDFGIRIARDGTWFHQGSPIGRKPMVKLFSTVLRREEDGTYLLVTPVERGRIEVEDAPFIAVRLAVAGTGRDQVLSMETNLDDSVTVDSDHPIRVAVDEETQEPSPYVTVRDRLEARINRAVYYELVELGVEEEVGGDHLYGVWSSGEFFPLGRLTEPA